MMSGKPPMCSMYCFPDREGYIMRMLSGAMKIHRIAVFPKIHSVEFLVHQI